MESADNIRKSPPHTPHSEEDDDFMGKDSWKITTWLSFHYFKVLTSHKKFYKSNC